MAKKVIVTLLDDVDGSLAAETLTFGLDGALFEIDLSEANAAQLREVLAPFAAAGRRARPNGHSGKPGRPKPAVPAGHRPEVRSRAPRPAGSREQDQAVRDWARKEGLPISDRGRIPDQVRVQFTAAH